VISCCPGWTWAAVAPAAPTLAPRSTPGMRPAPDHGANPAARTTHRTARPGCTVARAGRIWPIPAAALPDERLHRIARRMPPSGTAVPRQRERVDHRSRLQTRVLKATIRHTREPHAIHIYGRTRTSVTRRRRADLPFSRLRHGEKQLRHALHPWHQPVDADLPAATGRSQGNAGSRRSPIRPARRRPPPRSGRTLPLAQLPHPARLSDGHNGALGPDDARRSPHSSATISAWSIVFAA
jgi:hypothetical protein